MACSTIHLAIIKKYLENHKDFNYEKVIAGSLYPDAASANDISHYTDINCGNDNISHVRSKVNLYAFLKAHSKLNDFELGWFIHLVTDYLFLEDFCKDLYFAYTHLNLYLSKKYNITETDYKDYPSEYYPGKNYEDCILSKEKIGAFIIEVSSIDFDKYIKKIKEYKCNIKL